MAPGTPRAPARRLLTGRGLDLELAGTPAPPAGAWRWEVAVLSLLVAANVVQNEVFRGPAYVLTGPLLAVLGVVLARRAGASWRLLGLGREFAGRGLRVGAVAFGAVAGVVVLAGLLPLTSGYFADDRVQGASAGEALYQAFVRIPVGTAASEEMLFRGVAYGLLARRLGPGRAMLAESALFGLWHVLPTLASLRSNPATAGLAGPLEVGGALAAAVVTTALAGLAFTWLRRRSGSVLAPFLAHVATNSVTYLVAFVVR